MRARYPNSITAIITTSSETVKYMIEESQLDPKKFIKADSTKAVFGRSFEYYVFANGAASISNKETGDIVDYLQLHGAKDITNRFYIDEKEWFFQNKEELIKKFPVEFQELIIDSPLANMIFRNLLNGGDPYEMINLALTKHQEVLKQMVKIVEHWPGSHLELQNIINQKPSQTQ